jgi:hypothetical protein
MEIKGNQVILNVTKTDFADSGTYTAIIDNGIEKLEVPLKMTVGGNTDSISHFAHVHIYIL